MKIICIGRNYIGHAREMKSETPSEPVFFLKPDTSLCTTKEFFIPDFTNDLHHEIELVIKICKTGKSIDEKFAGKYYNEIGLGIDFTARDIQEVCKSKGLPWEKAKSFDYSAPVGKFISITDLDLKSIDFRLDIDGKTRQEGNSGDMIFSFDKIVSYVSRFITLKTGDLIFTGTPEGVGKVTEGNVLKGYLNGEKFLDLKIR